MYKNRIMLNKLENNSYKVFLFLNHLKTLYKMRFIYIGGFIMSKLQDNFLWGGAVAAHQLEGGYREGGKGISVADVMTAGANGVERKITNGIIEGEYYH